MKKDFSFYTKLITMFGFILFLFQTAMSMDIINVIMPIIEGEKGWSRGMINTVLSIATAIGIVAPFVFGTLFIKIGIKKMNFITIIIMCIATVGMGVATNIIVFAICMAIIQVVGMAMLIGGPAWISNWFFEKRGRMLGIITIGAPFSTALFTPLASKLIQITGYRNTFLIVAAVFLILELIIGFGIPERAEDLGFGMDGKEKVELAENKKAEKSIWTISKILSLKETWLIIVGFGAVYLMMTGIMSQMIARFTDQGIPISTALFILSVAAILGMPFSYFWGWLDDKISTPKTSGIFLLTYVIASFSMIFASSSNMACAVLAGFCVAATTGGMPNLIPSIMAWVFGGKEFVNVNRIIGIFHGLCRSASFIVMGFVFTRFNTYTPAYIGFIFVAIIGSICLFSIKKSYDPANKKYVEN